MRVLLLIALLSACSTPEPPPAAPEPSPAAPPSVILISIDTLRADRVGAYGYTARPTTPNLDQVAAQGIVFENHTSASPWTTPAHMTMLTGLEPRTHAVTHSFDAVAKDLRDGHGFWGLADETVTLAEVLKGAGYATGAFTAGATVDPRIGFGQGFDHFDTSMYKLHAGNVGSMIAWVRAQKQAGKPFFLFWHHFEVHAPYLDTRFAGEVLKDPAPLQQAIAQMEGVVRTANPPEDERRALHGKYTQALRDHGAWNAKATEALYSGGIAASDAWLGDFLGALSQGGAYDDTLVVITSDHGEEFAEHNPEAIYDRHGHSLYREVVDVPLVIKLPGGGSKGARVPQVTGTSDVMPTILDVLGLDAPTMQGRSLKPAWTGGALEERPVHSEALAWGYEQKAIRSGSDKLVFTMDTPWVQEHGRHALPDTPAGIEVFDLAADPGETKNLGGGNALLTELRAHHGRDVGTPKRIELDADTFDQLKALGYIED